MNPYSHYPRRSPSFRRLPRAVQDRIIDRDIRVREAVEQSLRNQWRRARMPRPKRTSNG